MTTWGKPKVILLWPASRHSSYGYEPRLRPALGEMQVLQIGPDLVAGWLNGLHAPALGESVVQFLLRHSAWPLRAWLIVAEAE